MHLHQNNNKHMKLFRIIFIATLLICCHLPLSAQLTGTESYSKRDSAKVVELLETAKQLKPGDNLVIHFARQLLDIPYVAKTLEKFPKERLIVNLTQLDCTTYVENVMALTLCTKNKKTTFADFCRYLRLLRYRNGDVSYVKRLHYFTEWIEDNTHMGFVKEVSKPNPPFTQSQKLEINYMSTHVGQYPMLVKNPEWVKDIAKMENELNGREYVYIPKAEISNTELFWDTIHDGDIIAITTNKKGLDISHIGFAIWGVGGLHMLNASQVRHKVVEEPMLLFEYMQKHPSQTGIRIIRPLVE